MVPRTFVRAWLRQRLSAWPMTGQAPSLVDRASHTKHNIAGAYEDDVEVVTALNMMGPVGDPMVSATG